MALFFSSSEEGGRPGGNGQPSITASGDSLCDEVRTAPRRSGNDLARARRFKPLSFSPKTIKKRFVFSINILSELIKSV